MLRKKIIMLIIMSVLLFLSGTAQAFFCFKGSKNKKPNPYLYGYYNTYVYPQYSHFYYSNPPLMPQPAQSSQVAAYYPPIMASPISNNRFRFFN